jgi:hypothetical protein
MVRYFNELREERKAAIAGLSEAARLVYGRPSAVQSVLQKYYV